MLTAINKYLSVIDLWYYFIMKITNGWSFGVITDGYHQSRIIKIVKSIISQNIPNFEIIIVGDKKEK